MMKCSGTQVLTTQSMQQADYDNIVAEVQNLYSSLPSNLAETLSIVFIVITFKLMPFLMPFYELHAKTWIDVNQCLQII